MPNANRLPKFIHMPRVVAVSALAIILVAGSLEARLPEQVANQSETQIKPPAPLDWKRYAQTTGDREGGESEGEGAHGADYGSGAAASAAQTLKIIEGVGLRNSVCGRTPREYRLDCISKSLREAAQKMPRNGDYAEARATLTKAADKLDALVKKERDPQKPRIRVRKSTSPAARSTKPLTAIKKSRVAAVHRQALPIIAEAETILLRSAASDAKRAVHYQKIAAAVGSNKVLLRSS